MADTLTSLLNSTIQAGETVIEAPLLGFLDALEDGVYKVGAGTFTLLTVDPVVDEITGTWSANSSTLTTTTWFTGQETASQELIDLVTGAADSSAYFAWDTDTATVPVAATVNTTGPSALQGAFNFAGTAWFGKPADAQAAAADVKATGVVFVAGVFNNGNFVGYKWDGSAVVSIVGSATTYTGTWATGGYIPSSTTTVTTVDTLHWDGDSVEVVTFQVSDSTSYATGVTDGYTSAIWDTNKQSLLGMELLGGDIQLQII